MQLFTSGREVAFYWLILAPHGVLLRQVAMHRPHVFDNTRFVFCFIVAVLAAESWLLLAFILVVSPQRSGYFVGFAANSARIAA